MKSYQFLNLKYQFSIRIAIQFFQYNSSENLAAHQDNINYNHTSIHILVDDFLYLQHMPARHFTDIVEPPRNGHLGTEESDYCREVGVIGTWQYGSIFVPFHDKKWVLYTPLVSR